MTVEQGRRGLGSRERVLLVVLVVIAIGGLAFVLLTGGDGAPDDQATITPTRSPSASPSPTEAPPPETGESFEGRDPFQPLVTDVAPPPPGGETPSPEPTGVVDGGNGQARQVSLLDVFSEGGERFATVQVDDDQFTVREGETFAENFRLLDLTRECGTFVFGDERFTLCIGQEVNK